MSGLQSLSRNFAGTRRLVPVELYPGALSYALIDGFEVLFNKYLKNRCLPFFNPQKRHKLIYTL
jgi:hypothetical protein